MWFVNSDLMPEEFKGEFSQLAAQIDDESVHPLEYLDKVDDFFRRLCATSDVDFDELFGGHHIEFKRMLEEKGQNGGQTR